MDYETADGSQFSLREELSKDGTFQHTLITAFVDGNAYVGKSPQRMEEMDDVDVIQYLEAVPPDNVFPRLPQGYTVAPPFDMAEHYLKAPQFTYEDREPGRTFVADTLLHEATILEKLAKKPHPSIATYYGAVWKEGRITHLCLQRCLCNLTEYVHVGLSQQERAGIYQQVCDGIEHLHSLGLAHNDINPDNVCVDRAGHSVLVDFDSCAPFGEALKKGVAAAHHISPTSARENDEQGLQVIRDFLFPPKETQGLALPAGEDDRPRTAPS